MWVGSSHCSPSMGSTLTSPCFQHPLAQTHSQPLEEHGGIAGVMAGPHVGPRG